MPTFNVSEVKPKSTVLREGHLTIEDAGLRWKSEKVWKVETTDDISNNSTINTYFMDKSTRKILKQEIDFGGGKMLVELAE